MIAFSSGASNEFYLDVAKGKVPGHSLVVIRGHNPDIDSSDGFVDVAEMGDLTYLTSAETMNIASTSANDSSAGTGVRTLLVQGVDGTGAAVQEVVTLNGTTDVVTANSYLRVNHLVGQTAGSVGWNVGNITATASTSSTIQIEADSTESISQGSHYTVPLGKTFYILQVEMNAAKTAGGGVPEIEFKAYFRAGGEGAAWIQFFDKKMDTGVVDELDLILPFPDGQSIARTDIRMQASTNTNNTEVRTRMYGLLVDD